VAGSCEYVDETSGTGATELVSQISYLISLLVTINKFFPVLGLNVVREPPVGRRCRKL
jgi:hypothetical protein